MNWTEEQFREYQQRVGFAPPFKPPANEAGAFARAQMPALKMNKTEAAYDALLQARKAAGKILWHRWQPMRLRLADGSYYKPDFGVVPADSCLFEIHETKGFWREAARVRIKIAAELFPFKFIAIKRTKGGGWEREEFA